MEALELEPELTEAPHRSRRGSWRRSRDLDNLALAREAHACTHTTFSPNIVHGGIKINVIPDRVEIDVDIRALPGMSRDEVDAMMREALGDLAPRVTIEHGRGPAGLAESPRHPAGGRDRAGDLAADAGQPRGARR